MTQNATVIKNQNEVYKMIIIAQFLKDSSRMEPESIQII